MRVAIRGAISIMLRFNTEINIQIFQIIEFKLIYDNNIIIIEKK